MNRYNAANQRSLVNDIYVEWRNRSNRLISSIGINKELLEDDIKKKFQDVKFGPLFNFLVSNYDYDEQAAIASKMLEHMDSFVGFDSSPLAKELPLIDGQPTEFKVSGYLGGASGYLKNDSILGFEAPTISRRSTAGGNIVVKAKREIVYYQLTKAGTALSRLACICSPDHGLIYEGTIAVLKKKKLPADVRNWSGSAAMAWWSSRVGNVLTQNLNPDQVARLNLGTEHVLARGQTPPVDNFMRKAPDIVYARNVNPNKKTTSEVSSFYRESKKIDVQLAAAGNIPGYSFQGVAPALDYVENEDFEDYDDE